MFYIVDYGIYLLNNLLYFFEHFLYKKFIFLFLFFNLVSYFANLFFFFDVNRIACFQFRNHFLHHLICRIFLIHFVDLFQLNLFRYIIIIGRKNNNMIVFSLMPFGLRNFFIDYLKHFLYHFTLLYNLLTCIFFYSFPL